MILHLEKNPIFKKICITAYEDFKAV